MTDRTEALDIEAIRKALDLRGVASDQRPYIAADEALDRLIQALRAASGEPDTDIETIRMYGTNACCQACYLDDPTEHNEHCGKAALDRLIHALKASNEERERLRANFALMLETMGRRSHAYRQALEQVADCQEKYSAPIARAALSHPIPPDPTFHSPDSRRDQLRFDPLAMPADPVEKRMKFPATTPWEGR